MLCGFGFSCIFVFDCKSGIVVFLKYINILYDVEEFCLVDDFFFKNELY